MSEQIKDRKVSDLTNSELDKAINALITFYDFTFFGERDVSESTGLCFALEYQACALGLVGDWLYDNTDDYNSADLMFDLFEALDKRAAENPRVNDVHWMYIKQNSPYQK